MSLTKVHPLVFSTVNSSALLVIGGWSEDGPMASVEMLDLDTGKWRSLTAMASPRYGHACLHTEVGGRDGIMVTGGALTGIRNGILVSKGLQRNYLKGGPGVTGGRRGER